LIIRCCLARPAFLLFGKFTGRLAQLVFQWQLLPSPIACDTRFPLLNKIA
jgi:hypothetical protein